MVRWCWDLCYAGWPGPRSNFPSCLDGDVGISFLYGSHVIQARGLKFGGENNKEDKKEGHHNLIFTQF